MANDLYVVDEGEMELPPGFRFHPTDEELITHYLSNKVLNTSFVARAVGVVDLNKVEPWELPKKAKMGKKEWYFFCQKDRKYPTGERTNRATEAGYWKATGKDKEIYKGKVLIGMKKTLVFYIGRAPRGEKSDWVMHEYRLHSPFSTFNAPKDPKSEWVLCRILEKNSGAKKEPSPELYVNEVQPHILPPLMDSCEKVAAPIVNTSCRVSCFTNLTNDYVNHNYYDTNISFSTAPLSSSQFLDFSMVEPNVVYQEHDRSSILKFLSEGNGSSLTMETGCPSGDVNGNMSTAVSYSELLQSPFEDRGNTVNADDFLNY